ncbi:hypothetical protein OUZ56_015769 [Daphnia magna]|uniref:Uncharacterized protein n=1 Tax=Daphnia magna TaxID=35525 RepID=A0ABR0AP59_9CRUS|nr:hypothetical protein OUZ56_015769 [Daphnia magna]
MPEDCNIRKFNTKKSNSQNKKLLGPNETRTRDLLLTRQALCHLSHETILHSEVHVIHIAEW